ncbi:MAG: OsmC family protein [Candidatus Omnitrophica bacterium]|nr:OsmC family protein [Candidatus Omnitrophota bacterium]
MTHGPSGTQLVTDAPKDNQGKGESFSPTDLVASALGSCMITIMGIMARQHNIDLSGLKCRVEKEMVSAPERRIGKLTVALNFAKKYSEKEKTMLERAALTCPVHKSINHEVEIPVTFNYPK